MKKVLFFLILNFFFSNITYSNTDIAFLDVQYIIDKSDLGVEYKKLIDAKVKEIKFSKLFKVFRGSFNCKLKILVVKLGFVLQQI